jgi:putative RecB family exonuclease
MVPPELRQDPHVSFTQLDTYLRCPLRYRLQYVDRGAPDFVPAALALGSGIHGAAALLFRGIASGARPTVGDVQAYFASLWALETTHRPVRFGERDSPESLLDLGTRMLAVLYAEVPDATEVVAVESAFAVPLVDQATGAVLDRDLVGTLDLVERDADGRLVVVDLKTAARKYSDLQVEASLQLSIYSYATAMNGMADEADLRLRFDVLTCVSPLRPAPSSHRAVLAVPAHPRRKHASLDRRQNLRSQSVEPHIRRAVARGPVAVELRHGRSRRDRGLAGVRAARVRGVPPGWPARARSAARAV